LSPLRNGTYRDIQIERGIEREKILFFIETTNLTFRNHDITVAYLPTFNVFIIIIHVIRVQLLLKKNIMRIVHYYAKSIITVT